MKLRQIVDEVGYTKTVIIENVIYNPHDVNKYKELYQNMVNSKYIKSSSFEDSVWYIYNFIANVYNHISFDLDVFKDIQVALKCFISAQLTLGKRADTVKRNVQFIKEIIFVTNGLKNFKLYEQYIANLVKSDARKCYLASRAIINFITFYHVPEGDRIIDISNSVGSIRTKNRDLPHFHDVMSYDSIINQYFREAPIENHLHFKPIQIWWATSTIIPMRPTEFLLIPFDCVHSVNDETFWLTVPRIKDDKDSPDEVISLDSLRSQQFQISKDLFHIISEFKIRLQQMDIDSSFLFSYDFYKTTFGNKATRFTKTLENRMSSTHFRKLLEKFNNQIVIGLFNEKFEMAVLPSHTRHFAIINMFLQGFNLLSIATLAGQLDLRTADNYYSHAKNFAKSYVYNFVTTNMGKNIGKKMSDGFMGWRREVIDKGKMYQKIHTSDLLKVDYGFCQDSSFPYNCGEHCGPCPSFIFKPEINDVDKALEWLESYSVKLENSIDITLESMIQTSKSLKEAFTPNKEESFSSKTRQLQSYLDHKIRNDLLLSSLKG